MKLGVYEVGPEVGRGRTGSVHSGRAPDGSAVAIKILHGLDAERLRRFERERRLLGSFATRDGFVPLLDAGVVDGRPYLVMPVMRGGTLRDRLVRGPLPVAEALKLAGALAAAIGRAHEKGVVHRSLRPENIFFAADDGSTLDPLVTDLGVAGDRFVEAPGASPAPCYAAPEQLDDDARGVGPPADVFALGAITYEAFAGTAAFWGAAGAREARPAPLRAARPEVPSRLAAVIERACARDPARRYSDAAAFGRALVAALEERAATRAVFALLVAVLALGGLVAVLVVPRLASRPAPAPAIAAVTTKASDAPSRSTAAAERHALAADERLRSGDVEGAVAGYTRAIEADSAFVVAWRNRAQLRKRKGDVAGALADLTRVVELVPREARSWAERGHVRFLQGDYGGAIDDATRALEIAPERLDARANRIVARQMMGHVDEAIAEANDAIASRPDFGALWRVRGQARFAKGDHEGAESDASRAVELDPKDGGAWTCRGQARDRKGDFAGAAADFTRALELELDPTNAGTLHAYRAMSRAKLEDLDGAIGDMTKALEVHPKAVRFWGNRAAFKFLKKDYAGAIEDGTRAVALDPKDLSAWTTLGEARLRSGDRDGALADLGRAIEHMPENGRAWCVRGDARATVGDIAGAISDYERAAALAPNEESRRVALRAIAEMRARAKR